MTTNQDDHDRPAFHGWENGPDKFVIMSAVDGQWIESDTWIPAVR